MHESQSDPPIRRAATVVPMRDGAGGLEVLLLQRHQKLVFYGGAWVFPGGRIDAEDALAAGTHHEETVARLAAVRETQEEAGLQLQPAALIPFAQWLTPPGAPRRFDTWYFAAPCPKGPVQIDTTEVAAYHWLTPAAALAARDGGQLELPPPTFVTLVELQAFTSTQEACEHLAASPMVRYETRVFAVPGGTVHVYEGDAAYADGVVDRPGPRHRVTAVGSKWRFERNLRD